MPHRNLHLIILSLVAIVYIALISLAPSVKFMPNIGWLMDRQRLLELLLISFVLIEASAMSLFNKSTFAIQKPLQLSLLILLILSIFSISLAFSPRHAAVEVSSFVGLAYLSLLIARWYQEDDIKFIKHLTIVIWVSILLYLVAFYTGYLTATITKKPLHWPLPFVGFSNIRSFNQYQLWSLGFILLPLLCFELNKTTRVFLHIASTAWWALLFYSASRGVLIAWLFGMCLTALVYQKLSWPFLRLQLTNILTGFISYQLLFKLIPAFNQSILVTYSVTRQTTNDRLALWDQAMIMVKSSPLFGVGPMHYAWFNKTNGHPHNSVLQLAAEWGLPATCLMLGLVVYGLYHWLKQFNRFQLQSRSGLESSLAIILFFTIASNAAYSLVDGVIVMPLSQVLMFTMIGLMIGQYALTQPITHHYQSRVRPIIAGILLIVLAWSVYPEIKQGFSGDKKGFSLGHTAIGPRFWRETK